MIYFITTLLVTLGVIVGYQLITKMKIVGGNELGIVSGKNTGKGFKTLSGGRIFIIPLINKFAKLDLTPQTIEVKVESAIAAGIVPLNVKATVSFAIASNEAGRNRAVTRILQIAKNWEELRHVASDIIEGHLRDSIASITPEQVMKDKDTLVQKMINICKNDLENIGLEITTMNIADVDDHRLDGVDEPDLYIALLKRIQTANAEMKARVAKAEARANAIEQQETRRAEIQVKALENEYENLVAATNVKVQEHNIRKMVGIQKAERDAEARVKGLIQKIEAEKANAEMLKQKYEAEIITPAIAERDRMILEAEAHAVQIRSKAMAEIEQLKETLSILKTKGKEAREAYLIENFNRIVAPFAQTMSLIPVKKLTVLTGASGTRGPISAIHPDAIDLSKNELLADIMKQAFAVSGAVSQGSRSVQSREAPGKVRAAQAAPSAQDPGRETHDKRDQAQPASEGADNSKKH